MTERAWWGAVLVALVVAVYANTVDNGFHFDDDHSIVENPHIRSLSRIPSYFVDASAFSGDPDIAMYRPALLVTYAVNHAVGGLRPAGYHAVNILLHAAASLLVLALISRLVDSRAGWWAAAVFAAHPVNSQVVNYVSSRSETLAALGVLGAFCLYAFAPRHGPSRREWLVGGAHLAGLAAKSTALVLMPLLAVYEWGRTRRWRLLWVPAFTSGLYLAASSATGFLTDSLQSLVRPLHVQAMTQTKAVAYYLYLLSCPFHLNVVHPFAEAQAPGPAVAAALLLALSVLWLGASAWKRGRPEGFGALWFLAGLALTFSMPLYVLVSEQRLYLSAAGASLVGAALFRGSSWSGRLPTAVALVALLGVATWQRNGAWQDELTLWQDAARHGPASDRVLVNLGEAYYETGDTARARAAYEGAIALTPHHAVAWNNLGVLREHLGQAPAAEAAYREALSARADWPEAEANLGRLLLNQGRHEEAQAHLATAVRRSPSASSIVNLGVAASRRGDLARAAELFARALQLEPGRADARINLAALRVQEATAQADATRRRQLLDEAAGLYEEILRQQDSVGTPSHPAALVNLAAVHAAAGRGLEAASLYQRAVAAHPGYAEAHAGYGRFLLERGQPEAAAAALRQAVALDSSSTPAWQDLGKAEAGRGRLEAAAAAFRAAAGIDRRRPEPLYNLGEVMAALGDAYAERGDSSRSRAAWQEAAQGFAAVEALVPDYRHTRARLQHLQERLR